jgi:DNA-binding LacI/PurR family transcriptional regulator
MRSKITLKHLSNISGFSVSTISRALNDKKDINKKTKHEIKKLAKTCDYIPNNSAIALRIKQTKIIAIIVPQINLKFYSNIVSEIQTNAFKKGYRVIILQSFFLLKKELECINNVKDGCVDGIIIINSKRKTDYSFNHHISFLKSDLIPTVVQMVDTNLNRSNYIGLESINLLLDKINKKTSVINKV